MSDPVDPRERRRVGLCAECRHVRRIRSGRGSVFYLCGRAAVDPRLSKYPRLPVTECVGHQIGPPSDDPVTDG